LGAVTNLAIPTRKDVGKFEPRTTRVDDAKLDAIIGYAQRLKDWPTLERAVDEKIKQQAEFVQWWKDKVRGDGRPEKTGADRGRFPRERAEELTGITHQQVSRWTRRLKDRKTYCEVLYGAAYRKAMLAAVNHRAGTGEDEWYTPAQYVEAARAVMGGIDLDPASSDEAQLIVQAKKFFSIAHSGLTRKWHGRVWMNPPYSQPLIHEFGEKLIAEASAGRVEQAVVVTHNSTDTLWFHRLEEIAAAICFTRGRIAFIDPQGDRHSPTQGQAFFYYGENNSGFSKIFRKFGFIR